MQSRELGFTFFKPVQEQNVRNNNQQMQSFFTPLHKEQVTESECHRTSQECEEGTKLTSLHGRLQQEADKIRKWKTHTEIELKQKDKVITENKKTVEALRKSILQVQLQNESLSLKLKEEIDNRNEIQLKLESTRDMCNLLKSHTSKIDEQLSVCETERTELKYLEKEHAKQFEELAQQFDHLSISSEEMVAKIKSNLETQERKNKELSELHSSELNKVKNEISNVNESLTQSTRQVETLNSEVHTRDEKITCLENELRFTKATLEETSKELSTRVNELQCIEKEYTDLEEEHLRQKTVSEELSQQLSATQANLNESTAAYEGKLNERNLKNEALQEAIDKEKKRYKDLETNYRKSLLSIEDLKSDKDILIMEKTEAVSKIDLLQQSLVGIKEQKEILTSEIAVQRSEKEDLLENAQSLNEEINKSRTKISSLNETIDLQLNELKELTDKYEDQQNALNNFQSDNRMLEEKLLDSQKTCNSQISEIEELTLELKSKRLQELDWSAQLEKLLSNKEELEKEKSFLERHVDDIKENLEECKNKVSTLEERDKESNRKIQSITKEKKLAEEASKEEVAERDRKLEDLLSKVEFLESEVKAKEEDLSNLNCRSTEARNDTAAKNKQIKELEKEIRNIKSKLGNQTKKISAHENDVKGLNEKLESMELSKNAAEKEITSLKYNLDKSTEQLKKTTEQAEKNQRCAKQTTKEKEDARKEFDCKMKEMIKTLDEFKKENEKIVLQKELEIEHLKKQVSKTQESKLLERENDEMKKEVDHMAMMIKQLKKDKEDGLKETENKQRKIEMLEREVKSRDMVATDCAGTKQAKPVPSPKPATPKSKAIDALAKNVRMSSTPKTPRLISNLAVVKAQPFNQATPSRTPTLVLRTPQNKTLPLSGILRQANSVPKKRHVMFSSDNSKDCAHSDSGESSTSELMDVEVETMPRGKTRPSPSVRLSPGVSRLSKRQTASGKQAARHKTAKHEMEEFRQLFPNHERDRLFPGSKSTRLEDSPSPAKIRKSLNKSPGKFFKSPSRVSKGAQKNKKESKANWFDCDSIFGFGADENEP